MISESLVNLFAAGPWILLGALLYLLLVIR